MQILQTPFLLVKSTWYFFLKNSDCALWSTARDRIFKKPPLSESVKSKQFFEEKKNTFIYTIAKYIFIILRSSDAFIYFYKKHKIPENVLRKFALAIRFPTIIAYKISQYLIASIYPPDSWGNVLHVKHRVIVIPRLTLEIPAVSCPLICIYLFIYFSLVNKCP